MESRASTGHAPRVHSKDRKTESPSDKADAFPEEIPLPLPQQPQTAEAEVEVDMYEDPRPILDEIKLLHQVKTDEFVVYWITEVLIGIIIM